MFDPAYETQRRRRLPALQRKQLLDSVDFFKEAERFREQPTLEHANRIKRRYIDGAVPSSQQPLNGKDPAGPAASAHALHIGAQHQCQFNSTYARCLMRLDSGETVQEVHLAAVFNMIEAFVADRILSSLE